MLLHQAGKLFAIEVGIGLIHSGRLVKDRVERKLFPTTYSVGEPTAVTNFFNQAFRRLLLIILTASTKKATLNNTALLTQMICQIFSEGFNIDFPKLVER